VPCHAELGWLARRELMFSREALPKLLHHSRKALHCPLQGVCVPISLRMKASEHKVLEFWAELFPKRKPDHFVFPVEKCGGAGKKGLFGFSGGVSYGSDPTNPIGDWKEAWEAAKKRAGAALDPNFKKTEGLHCRRFHDLRHTGCTRMLEGGVPYSVVAVIMGWSPSAAVRMAKRYGHIGHVARREAIDRLSRASIFDSAGAQKWAQLQGARAAAPSRSNKGNGSSGRTRTYNPPVNSRMLCH
jgi:hypothetical protein